MDQKCKSKKNYLDQPQMKIHGFSESRYKILDSTKKFQSVPFFDISQNQSMNPLYYKVI